MFVKGDGNEAATAFPRAVGLRQGTEEALELARRLVGKNGQSRKETTEAARKLLQSEKGDSIRAQAAKRVAELKDLIVA